MLQKVLKSKKLINFVVDTLFNFLSSGLSPCTDYQFSVEHSPGSSVARPRAPVTVWTSSARTLVSLDIRVAMGYNTANISAFYRSETPNM